MLITRQWIETNYNKFNKLYWEGKLPKIMFKISRSRKFWGYAEYQYDWTNSTIIPQSISMSNYYDSPENVKLETLLHEMIHIADYTFFPEHYIKNGRRVSKKMYDPHGHYFLSEAKRLSKFGWDITKYVTKNNMNVSILSENAKRLIKQKQERGIAVVIEGTRRNFLLKTDVNKFPKLKAKILKCRFNCIGDLKRIKTYTFKDENFATESSCTKCIKGWYMDKLTTMNKLKSIKATEIKL